MKRTVAVLSIFTFVFWYFNSGVFYLVAAIVLGGSALGIFGLFTETIGWMLLIGGGFIIYEGFVGVGIFMGLIGVMSIKMARTHGLLYDFVFVSMFSFDLDDDG